MPRPVRSHPESPVRRIQKGSIAGTVDAGPQTTAARRNQQGFMVPPCGAVERRRRTSPSSTTAASVVRSLAACARAWASNSSRMSTVVFTYRHRTTHFTEERPGRWGRAANALTTTCSRRIRSGTPITRARRRQPGLQVAAGRATRVPGRPPRRVVNRCGPAATVVEALRRRPALVVELGEAAGEGADLAVEPNVGGNAGALFEAGARFVRRSSCGDRDLDAVDGRPRAATRP